MTRRSLFVRRRKTDDGDGVFRREEPPASPLAVTKTGGKQARRRSRWAPSVSVLLLVLCFVMMAVIVQLEDVEDLIFEWSSALLDGSNRSWSCQPKDERFSHPRRPIIVLSEQRSGSSLFFDLLRVLFNEQHHDGKAGGAPELLSFYELFLVQEPADTKIMLWLGRLLDRTCRGSELLLVDTRQQQDSLQTKEAVFSSLEERRPKGWEVISRPIMKAFLDRMNNSAALLGYMFGIPSASNKSFYSFKVFSEHFNHMHMSPYRFLRRVAWTIRKEAVSRQQDHDDSDESKIEYIVVWRRRIIESFVSLEIANRKRDGYANVKTTADDSIRVDLEKLESFVSAKRRYYTDVKIGLDHLGADYHVFEYERDLLTLEQQVETVRRLGEALHVPVPDSPEGIARSITQASWVRQKQGALPLQEVVENWDEVVTAGFGGDTADWEDLFPPY